MTKLRLIRRSDQHYRHDSKQEAEGAVLTALEPGFHLNRMYECYGDWIRMNKLLSVRRSDQHYRHYSKPGAEGAVFTTLAPGFLEPWIRECYGD